MDMLAVAETVEEADDMALEKETDTDLKLKPEPEPEQGRPSTADPASRT